MKKLITIHHLDTMMKIQDLTDGFIIGNKRFGARLTASFTPEEINRAIDITQSLHKDIFLIANRIFDDQDCDDFKTWLKHIKVEGLTGIIVADLGAISVLDELGLIHQAVYHPETLLTNQYDANVFASEGILGAFVAKEITLEEIKHIGLGRKLKLFMIGHGYLDMFYSKRQLVETFSIKANLASSFHDHKELTLIEAKRHDEPYPILEDDAGTHVFRYHVFHTEQYLDVLKDAIDYLVIDTIFEDDHYAEKILTLYQHPDDVLANEIKQMYDETWDEAFLHKPTMYKVKGDNND